MKKFNGLFAALPFLAGAVLVHSAGAGLRAPGVWGFPIDPSRSNVAISGQGSPCQFRFDPAGDRDVLTVSITVRDAFDTPVPSCSTTVTMIPEGPETFNVCFCCGEKQSGFTDVNGTASFSWGSIGGFGTMRASVTVHCAGNIALAAPAFDYTSSDLNGSCDQTMPAINILDIALWARGLPPNEWIRSDHDCSGGSADVSDLGSFASGIGESCADGPPCP